MSEGIRKFGIGRCSTRVDPKSTALDGSNSTREDIINSNIPEVTCLTPCSESTRAEYLDLDLMGVDIGYTTPDINSNISEDIQSLSLEQVTRLTPCSESTRAEYLDLDLMAVDYATPASPSSPKVELIDCIQELERLQDQHDRLESEYYAKIHCLETQLLCDIQPLCLERAERMNSREDPEFWLRILKFFGELRPAIAVEDEDALSHLTDIRWSRTDDLKGSKLEFLFDSAANPYFENRVLTKQVYFKMFRGQRMIEKTYGTEIKWRKDKCLTENVESFFKFFIADDLYASNFFLKHDYFVDFWQVIMNGAVLHANTYYKAACYKLNPLNMFDRKDGLIAVQDQIDVIVFRHSQNIRKEEVKYWKAVGNIHEKRGEIVSKYLVDGEEQAMLGPAFWLNAMISEETLDPFISDDDAKALGYLKNIKFSTDGVLSLTVWQIEFFFNPNPYFKNSVLTKVIHFYYSDRTLFVTKNMGTEIEWLPGCFFPEDPEQLGDANRFFILFNSLETDNIFCEREHYIWGKIIHRIVSHATSFYLEDED